MSIDQTVKISETGHRIDSRERVITIKRRTLTKKETKEKKIQIKAAKKRLMRVGQHAGIRYLTEDVVCLFSRYGDFSILERLTENQIKKILADRDNPVSDPYEKAPVILGNAVPLDLYLLALGPKETKIYNQEYIPLKKFMLNVDDKTFYERNNIASESYKHHQEVFEKLKKYSIKPNLTKPLPTRTILMVLFADNCHPYKDYGVASFSTPFLEKIEEFNELPKIQEKHPSYKSFYRTLTS